MEGLIVLQGSLACVVCVQCIWAHFPRKKLLGQTQHLCVTNHVLSTRMHYIASCVPLYHRHHQEERDVHHRSSSMIPHVSCEAQAIAYCAKLLN